VTKHCEVVVGVLWSQILALPSQLGVSHKLQVRALLREVASLSAYLSGAVETQ